MHSIIKLGKDDNEAMYVISKIGQQVKTDFKILSPLRDTGKFWISWGSYSEEYVEASFESELASIFSSE